MITAMQSPYLAWTHGAGEMPMLPRVIQMILRIIAARTVTDPSIVIGMHVGCSGMSGRLARSGRKSWVCAHGRRSMSRYMSAAHAMRCAAPTVGTVGYTLRKCAERQH
jgi:hypothetical protein